MARRPKKSKLSRFSKAKRLSYRVPVVVAASQLFAVGIVKCVSVLSLSCSERFLPHLWRAVQLSVSARGNTFVGIGGTLVYPIIIAIRDGTRVFWEKGWPGVRDLIKQRYAMALSIAGAIWLILVMWNFIFMEPRSFSVSEIADYSQGIVVDLAATDSNRDAIGTGFWVDAKGYMLTCSQKREMKLAVAAIFPPHLQGRFLIESGSMYTPGESIYFDSDTGIELVRVYNNPFIRNMHLFASVEDKKTHKIKEFVTEKFWVPCLSPDLAKVGEQIFLVGVEPSQDPAQSSDKFPEVSVVEGRVIRLGLDTSVKKHSLRIYTTLPWKASYRGSPVLDLSKRVIGIVMDLDSGEVGTGNSVLIPAKYAVNALTEATPSMSKIQPTVPFN